MRHVYEWANQYIGNDGNMCGFCVIFLKVEAVWCFSVGIEYQALFNRNVYMNEKIRVFWVEF